MSYIDLVVKTSFDGVIEVIQNTGCSEKWFDGVEWNVYRGRHFKEIFKAESESEVIEFHGLFFRYQCMPIDEEEGGGVTYYFSSEMVMKDLFMQTLEKVTEGVQIYDKNGYFVYSNQASEKLGDYNRNDFMGRHLLDIYDLSEEFSTTLSVIRSNAPVLNRCDTFRKKSGKELITINSGYPLEINGKLIGAVSFEGDLTLINNMKNKSFSLEAFIRNEKPVVERRGFCFEDIIHDSEKMASLIKFAKKISLTDTNVLITGETGTGKELFAQSIHHYSPRRDQPFIDINCGAIPSNLVESVFFGTEKGAFTGSVTKQGLLELADGGTLFLDEINSMGLDMQSKLLRALQENRFQRIGGQKYIECNLRIIAASNEDLRRLSAENGFRKDLYYRISNMSLDVPPLRERKSDIQLLLNHFIGVLSKKYGKRKLDYTKHFKRIMELHDWPGNVRELQHIVEYAINHMPDGAQTLSATDLPDYLNDTSGIEVKRDKTELSVLVDENETLVEKLAAVEEVIIKKALQDHLGNVTKAAESLGLSRQSLQYRMSKFE